MAFFENLSKKASETSAKAIQKAKVLSETARLNSLVSDEEKRIDENYGQIGRRYMAMHPQDYEADFAGMIQAIRESEEKRKNYLLQIQEVKGVQRCEKCGAEVPNGTAFCGSCGTPMPKPAAPEEAPGRMCPNCGCAIVGDPAFCGGCGAKLHIEEN